MSFAPPAAGAVARGNAEGGGKRRAGKRRTGATLPARSGAPGTEPRLRRLRRRLFLRPRPPPLPPQAAGSPARPPPAIEHSWLGLGPGYTPGPARPAPPTNPGLEAEGAGAGAKGLRRAQRPRPVAGSVGCGVWGGVSGAVGTTHHARTVFSPCAALRLGRPPQPLGVPPSPSCLSGPEVPLDPRTRHQPISHASASRPPAFILHLQSPLLSWPEVTPKTQSREKLKCEAHATGAISALYSLCHLGLRRCSRHLSVSFLPQSLVSINFLKR